MTRSPTLLASTDGRVLAQFHTYLQAADEVLLASAYVSPAALETLLPDFERIVRHGGSVQFYAAFDGGAFTRPEAFRRLTDLKRRAPDRIGVYVNPRQGGIFHAKAFLFRNRRGWRGLVGSANLTNRGLSGVNFEVCTDWPEMSTKDVEAVRKELNLLRTRGQLTELTVDRLNSVLDLYGTAPRLSPQDQALRVRILKGARENLKQRIEALKPGALPALAPLEESAREWTQNLAHTGSGVAVTTELTELSISLQVDPFVRARIVAKETTRQLGLATESTRKGYSISLIPADLRQRCSTAARSIGRLIGFRSIDLGYSRWIPDRFVVPLEQEISTKAAVADAEAALQDDHGIEEHLEKIRKQFENTVTKTVSQLPLRPKTEWDLDANVFTQSWLSRNANENEVRAAIAEYMKRAHATKISTPFVWSQLRRVCFKPRTFQLPLEQRMADDLDYGHKTFLAAIVWSFTDRVLKFDDEDVHGAGELFDYLLTRHQLNAPRREKRGRPRRTLRDLANALSEESATWLDTTSALEVAVECVRTAFGPSPWTWLVEDL